MNDFWKTGIEWNQPLWRYYRADRLGHTLKSSQLYFPSPKQFEDPFEGCSAVLSPEAPADPRYQSMDAVEKAFFSLRNNYKISCWHRADYESDAMWKIYAGERKGVAICTTPERMRHALKPYRVQGASIDEPVWAGNVRYQDFLVSPRLGLDIMDRLFYKHRAFEWEREFRLIISLDRASEWVPGLPKTGIEVEVDLDVLMTQVVIGPAFDGEEEIVAALRGAGLETPVVKSSLLGQPRFI